MNKEQWLEWLRLVRQSASPYRSVAIAAFRESERLRSGQRVPAWVLAILRKEDGRRQTLAEDLAFLLKGRGSMKLSDLYEEARKQRGVRWGDFAYFQNTVRATLQRHSSGSKQWRPGKPDLFYKEGHRWGLKS